MKLNNKIALASLGVGLIGLVASFSLSSVQKKNPKNDMINSSIIESKGNNNNISQTNLTINYSAKTNGKIDNLGQRFFDLISIHSDKEYIDSILGKPRVSKYYGTYYLMRDFVVNVSYKDRFAERIEIIPISDAFSKTFDISKYYNGYYSGDKILFFDATIGDFLGKQGGELTEIDANQAGGGNMQCINHASYTYKIKLNPMGSYHKITVGYLAPPCVNDDTGLQYYKTNKKQDSLLYEGVFYDKPSNFLDLKINFIEIEATDET